MENEMELLIIVDNDTTCLGRLIANKIYHQYENAKAKIVFLENRKFDEYIAYFIEMNPEMIVTLDMAGFFLFNDKKEIIYNYMYCKCIHILTQSPWYYPEQLLRRVNFNTIYYTSCFEDASYLKRYYENLPRVKSLFSCSHLRNFERISLNDTGLIFMDYELPEKVEKRIRSLPSGFLTMAERIFREWKCDDTPYLPDKIEQYLKSIQCPYTDEEMTETVFLLKDIPLYFEMQQLQEYLERRICNRINTDVCGAGWDSFICSHESDFLHIVEENLTIYNETEVSQQFMQSIMDLIRKG